MCKATGEWDVIYNEMVFHRIVPQLHLCWCFAITVHTFSPVCWCRKYWLWLERLTCVLCTHCILSFLPLPCISCSVYNSLGYGEIVGRAAEQSMQAGVSEVQALPDKYARRCSLHWDVYFCYNSGWCLMLGTTQQPRPTTLQLPVLLEGGQLFLLLCKTYMFIYLWQHKEDGRNFNRFTIWALYCSRLVN